MQQSSSADKRARSAAFTFARSSADQAIGNPRKALIEIASHPSLALGLCLCSSCSQAAPFVQLPASGCLRSHTVFGELNARCRKMRRYSFDEPGNTSVAILVQDPHKVFHRIRARHTDSSMLCSLSDNLVLFAQVMFARPIGIAHTICFAAFDATQYLTFTVCECVSKSRVSTR